MVNKFTCIHKHQETERDLEFLQCLISGGTRWERAVQGRPFRGNLIVKILPNSFRYRQQMMY